MNNKSSGGLGLAALIGVGVVGFLLKSIIPSLGRIFMGAAVVGLVLLALLIGVVIYFAFSKTEEKPESDGAVNLSKGRAKLTEIRRQNMSIKNKEIRDASDRICASADKIFAALREQPEDLPRMRQLFSYYLPTWSKILKKYSLLEDGGIADARMTESMVLCLRDIQNAMDKMYQNLFEDDVLDLTVEMEVLNMVGRRDGLLEEGPLQAEEQA